MIPDNISPVSLEEGIKLINKGLDPVTDTELVPLMNAHGRILAENILALHDQPPFPRSPLDGYAFRSSDTIGASKSHPAILRVITEVDAGDSFTGEIKPGECVRIMTGAPVPDGCDAVAGQEDTDYGEDNVSIYYEFRPYQNYCRQGEDYSKGDVLLADRTYIGPVEAGVIASLGANEVRVYRKPRVLLISTGSELVTPGEKLSPGKIYDSNLYTLNAVLAEWKAEVTDALHVSDDPEEAAGIIRSRIQDADLLITTGGVSVGKKDIMHDVFSILGAERTFWRIGIKPGMAMLSGIYNNTPILALSGNPYAAFIDMHLVVRQAVMTLAGCRHLEMIRGKSLLADTYDKKSPTRRFVRAYVEDGTAHIEGHTGGNGDISSGLGINALIDIPAGSPALAAGDTVDILYL